MVLIYLILGSVMMFQSGMFWTAYRVDNDNRNLYWCIGLALFSLYLLISMIGRASTI